MKPITIGFCADAVPASPKAAAPAALPNNARRPNLKLSIMFAPSPDWHLRSGQQALCQRFGTQNARDSGLFAPLARTACMQSGGNACFLGLGTHFVCNPQHAAAARQF